MLNGCLVNRHTLERTTICSTILSFSLSRKHSIRSMNASRNNLARQITLDFDPRTVPFVSFICNNGSSVKTGNSVDAFPSQR